MLRDLLHHVIPSRGISPVSGGTDNTASVSQIIDCGGTHPCAGVLWIINLGSLADADATFAVTMDEGDVSNLSDAAAVPTTSLISSTAGTAALTAAGFTFAGDDTVEFIDYIVTTKRYVRLTITPSANTGAWLHGAVALKYGCRHNPAGVTMAP